MTHYHEVTDFSTDPPTVTTTPFTDEEEAAESAAWAAMAGDLIDIERDRRIALPLTVTVAGLDPFPVNMDVFGQTTQNGIASGAILQKITSDTTPLTFRDYNNTNQTLSVDQQLEMGVAVKTRFAACLAASWALKALDPVPQDYTADSYWPAAS